MDNANGAGAGPPVLISMLEHFSYCPRQCALIHLDQSFDENIYTLRGRLAHSNVHQAGTRSAGGARIEHSLPLWSKRLGLVGKADAVEFRDGVPYPVEHKIGKLKRDRHADLQLCAQALCLEDMTGRDVPVGAVYHIRSRRRREVEFTPELREEVCETVVAIRDLLSRDSLPRPPNDRRCRRCSMARSCLPDVIGDRERLQALADSLFRDS